MTQYDTKQIWQSFIDEGEAGIDQFAFDPYLKKVWLRCRRQQNSDHWPPPYRAKGITFASILRNREALMNIAVPTIEDSHEYLETSCCAFILTDDAGCTLKIFGSPLQQAQLSELGIGEGTYWRETTMGNNAITTSLYMAVASQSVGYEHFKRALHPLANYAAPIFDHKGDTIGSVALIMPVEDASRAALGLIHSVAKNIGSQLQAETYLNESNQHLSEVHVLLEGIEEGVIAWYPDGVIHYLNSKGGHILGLNSEKVLGCQIESIVNLPKRVTAAIDAQLPLEIFETSLEVEHRLLTVMLSLNVVKNSEQGVYCYIALLHPVEHFRQLLHHHAGNYAHLTFDDLPEHSPAMMRVFRSAKHAAKGQGAVLLSGPEGVGKSHLAQAIHNASDRQNKPFVSVNCGALPSELMTTEFLGELAGQESGLITKFELAQGGTLYLEQIEALTAEVQVAMLQMIKTGLLNRLDRQIVPVDVRIIASSDANLHQLVEEARFRRQLLYELQSFDIRIPPLAERAEDVPVLVLQKLQQISGEVGRNVLIRDDAMQQFREYLWPGNSRELRNAVDRAFSQSDGQLIRLQDLPDTLLPGNASQTATDAQAQPLNLQAMERKTIIQAAVRHHGKVNLICEALNISRTTLWRRLKQFQIDITDYKP